MNATIIFIIVAIILLFVIIYRSNVGDDVYKFINSQGKNLYSKIAPYTYKEIKKKIKDLGQDYSAQQYIGFCLLLVLVLLHICIFIV